jgi:hypothetical protein
VLIALLAAGTSLAGPSAAHATDVRPFSATGCTGGTCLFVNGTGLRVNYAVVTNVGSHVGRGLISSTWDGRTHAGPILHRNGSWRFDYNRIMNNGNKVCGSIEGLDVACVTVHP